MPHVVTEPCIGTKDKACVSVCPVDCFYEGSDQLFINPDECIDCGACIDVCPVVAIYPDDQVPEKWQSFVDKNASAFTSDNPPPKAEAK
ncbi:MAG: indolepyruvate ferredoxin oxidoreductase subunit alpha [Candidatus Sericytochromatia bacterium]|jgi:NAD-dependent dihydropyrimidine dehydrogenase PreA subunit